MNDEEALGYFKDYKWQDGYRCLKCSNDNFKKGKSPYSRKCSKCDYDESVLKATAFEGLHLPPGKIYMILRHLAEYTYLEPEAKVFPLKEDGVPIVSGPLSEKEIKDIAEGKPLKNAPYSLMDINHPDEDKLNEKLVQHLASYKTSIGKLAKLFDVERNTISKLFDRIQSRQYLDTSHELNSQLDVMNYLNVPNTEEKMRTLLTICLRPIIDKV